MKFCDVAGPPGVGKSALCDDAWKPPRHGGISWDGLPYPDEWKDFIACTEHLLTRIQKHETYAACKAMTHRALKKMATVHRMQDDRIYIQTGLLQRAYGFGYRLKDPNEIEDYLWLMPVSVGVVILFADAETIMKRNVARGKDRSFMVKALERPRDIAIDVLTRRGVNLLQLDTRRPLAENLDKLNGFANR